MRNKYISRQSNELLSYFNEQDRACFGYAEAFKALPGSKESAVKELLSDMTKRGLLMRLREGVYYIIPYEADSKIFMPDWHLIPQYIVKEAQSWRRFCSITLCLARPAALLLLMFIA